MKCEHNDHSHILLWLCLFWNTIGMFDSCNHGRQSTDRDVAALRREVEELKQDVARLERR